MQGKAAEPFLKTLQGATSIRPAAEPHLERLLGVEHLHCLVKPQPTKLQEPSIHVKGSNYFDELHGMGGLSCFGVQYKPLPGRAS